MYNELQIMEQRRRFSLDIYNVLQLASLIFVHLLFNNRPGDLCACKFFIEAGGPAAQLALTPDWVVNNSEGDRSSADGKLRLAIRLGAFRRLNTSENFLLYNIMSKFLA